MPLLALLAIGVALEAAGVVDWRAVLERARGYAAQPGAAWTLALAIVVAQTLLYMLAQPGSALFWVAALIYPPGAATLILTAGGTLGAVAAYGFAARSMRGRDLRATPGAPVYAMLARQGDFFTLCALRLVPGMPHAVLNYASGALGVALWRFIPATLIALALKSYVYAAAVHGVASEASMAPLLRVQVLGPLLGLGALLLGARWYLARRRRRGRRAPHGS